MAQCPSGLRGVIRTKCLIITYALHALVQIQLASIFLPHLRCIVLAGQHVTVVLADALRKRHSTVSLVS